MNIIKKAFFAVSAVLAFATAIPSFADSATDNIIGAGGYDLTTYFSQEKPQRGNGHHVAEVDRVTYVFATDENKKEFVANPQKYLPQFGGYCAYGVSVSKKFVADPEQFDIVDGKLYLNLDAKIRSIWLKDTASRITDGNTNWKVIANKKAAEL
ncbi:MULTISPECIES: YHS domain-containing (seleno)protein [unclassified Undibacterium]|uniref:YHS domain-containing (seleno)protein n=1 Tax=unclassified Undibacterium TaxID=2630295 RepID=UPI002AC9083F|nr:MULTISPECIES: YHS domain-containing (seleno)protein [unclassified Undibacterium]MEB0137656.1 YHS domain-containing (seleno)protein [Undibacterium sp. CCC2.1]MEB0172692.1 YHS domain-containing (seleno)protein [Undibacterium sp. CCC1.1]MEB0177394.1 YHS domain-containing (seleno)protein [Undibacterium sp. CCC3.4]MEB0215487.1 YHS domain-containing (seleno)protein [Undibacterium sp. 5I2]WPX42232.1 YHS domain-containing (seleno)protein [Undibacterium sp. CCC3.4]